MAEIFPDEGLDAIMAVLPKNGSNYATLYVGLFTSATATTVPARSAVLSTATGVTEATGTAYARQSIAAASWGAQSTSGSGRASAAGQVTFPTVGAGGWGTANGFFIATAVSAGIALFYANFDSLVAEVLAAGDIIKVTPTILLNG